MASAPAEVTVSYTKPTSGSDNAITDLFANDAAGFTDEDVINYNMRSSNAVRVVGMTFSGSGADNLYTSGETLDVTVEFTQAVTLSLVGKNSNGRQIEERYRRMGLQTAGPVLGMGRECRSAHENVHGHTAARTPCTTAATARPTSPSAARSRKEALASRQRAGERALLFDTETSRERRTSARPSTPTIRPTSVRTWWKQRVPGSRAGQPSAVRERTEVWKEGDAGEGKTVEVSYTFSAPVRIVETRRGASRRCTCPWAEPSATPSSCGQRATRSCSRPAAGDRRAPGAGAGECAQAQHLRLRRPLRSVSRPRSSSKRRPGCRRRLDMRRWKRRARGKAIRIHRR